jgi:hypothetical protein
MLSLLSKGCADCAAFLFCATLSYPQQLGVFMLSRKPSHSAGAFAYPEPMPETFWTLIATLVALAVLAVVLLFGG